MRLHLRYGKSTCNPLQSFKFLIYIRKQKQNKNIVIKQKKKNKKKQKIMTECKFGKQKYSPKGEIGGEKKKKAIYKYNHTYLTIAT